MMDADTLRTLIRTDCFYLFIQNRIIVELEPICTHFPYSPLFVILKMSIELSKVATVEIIRELERRLRCNEIKDEKLVQFLCSINRILAECLGLKPGRQLNRLNFMIV